LPTGRIQITGNYNMINLTAGTGYSLGGDEADLYINDTASYNITLGKTSTGRTHYQLSGMGDSKTLSVRVLGSDATPASAGNSTGLLLVEEEEGANNNIYSIFIPASEELSGSTHQIIAGTPEFTAPFAKDAAQKTDTSVTEYVDLYGTFVTRDTDNQDTVIIYYPDEQMTIDLFVLGLDGSVSTSAAVAGEAVDKAIPYKTALAKVDSAVTQTDKETKNLILVGGPDVNSLVTELAAAGKTKDSAWYAGQPTGSAIIDLVENAWATGAHALVVAGKDAAGTRAASAVILKYDDYAASLTGSGVVVQGTVITSQLS